jgi:hypothetical protein
MGASDNISKGTHLNVNGTNVKSLQVPSLSSFADPIRHLIKRNAQIPIRMAPLPGDMVLNVFVKMIGPK